MQVADPSLEYEAAEPTRPVIGWWPTGCGLWVPSTVDWRKEGTVLAGKAAE